MGCCTEPAAVHIAHVLQRLHFFQFFIFFYNSHDLPQKKNYTHLPQKQITRLDNFFVHDLHFSQRLYPTYKTKLRDSGGGLSTLSGCKTE